MNVFVLTSSRADYGIYLPLLKKIHAHHSFSLKLVVFGTHLSKFHGYTLKNIETDGFEVSAKIETVLASDEEESIATSMGLTMLKFATYWQQTKQEIDVVLALGDRYEMFAAVAASVPFNLPIAHLHGGETTLGAIDDKLRHSMTLMSKYHFTSTETHYLRVKELIGSDENVWNVGALSLDNLSTMQLLNAEEFKEKFLIDLSIPTILVTLHPETVAIGKNKKYAEATVAALTEASETYQIVITMPNADTAGNIIREEFLQFKENRKKVIIIENFGTQGYFTCIKYCAFLLGNTSSGIIEAASFGKYVVNLGDRQKGRLSGKNVINIPFDESQINSAIIKISQQKTELRDNLYFNGGASDKIISCLLDIK
jgi:GDP/UDP-N,N'-diacetylbacillosamine 2-epimerase (hydrolysing)